MTILHRITPLAAAILTLIGCSESKPVSTAPQTSNTFADNLIAFPIPDGGSVQRAAENSYLVFFGEEMYYLMLRGAAEPEDFGRQRTEAARTETIAKQGKPINDGESVITVGEVSEVARHKIADDPVYLFTHSAAAKSKGENGIGYNTIGFGSVDGVAIWFQHTSASKDEHPGSVLGFLEGVTFKQGEQ
jgi:hypothetical protein